MIIFALMIGVSIGVSIGGFIYHRMLIRRMKQAGIDPSQGANGNRTKNGATPIGTNGMTKS